MASPAAVLNILITANASQAQAALARTDAQLKKTAATANTSSGATGAAIAKGAKTGALAVGALTTASVVAAAKFESSFAEVRKTVDASEKQFDRLSRGLRDLAKEIPISAGELAELAGQAGALGIKARDLLKFTRTAAELGIATDMSAEQAANALARLSNIMGTSSKDFRRLGSTMVELGNRSAATESEISEMALRIAGAGKQVGLSEAQVLSYAAALASVGVRAEAGGSSISRAFITMAEAVDKGGADLAGFAEVAGISGQKFAQLFEKDAARAMILFTEGLESIRKEGGSVFSVLEGLELNEIRVRDALLRASGAGELFRKTLKVGGDEWARNSALTEEANRRYETTAAQFQILKNRVNDLAISFGTLLLPAVNAAMKEIGEGFPRARRAISEFFGGKEEMRSFVDALRSLGRAVEGVIQEVVLPIFRRIAPAVKDSFRALAQTLRGAMRIIAGILTLRFGLAWKGVKDIFAGGVKGALATFRGMTAPAREVVSRIGSVMGKGFDGAWDLAKDTFRSGARRLVKVMGGMAKGIGAVIGPIKDVFQGLGRVVKAVVRFIVRAVNRAVNALGDLKSKIPDITPDLNLPSIPTPSIPDFNPFQRGGRVPGYGVGDKVNAMLEPNEFVVNSKATKRHRALLEAINKSPARLQTGGLAGPTAKMANRFVSQFGGSISSGLRPGDDGFHGRGLAFDWVGGDWARAARYANRIGPKLLEGIYSGARGPSVSWDSGQRVPPSFWGGSTWAGHADHIHVAIGQMVKGAMGAAFEKIKRIQIEGKGPLADVAQGAADKMRRAANKYLAKIAPSVGVESGVTKGLMSKSQIASVWRRANRGQGNPGLMAAIALAESAGNPRAVGHDPGGTQGLGLWQITTGFNDDLIRRYGGRRGMFNAFNNAQAAGDILARQGLNAWVVYGSGAYRQHLKQGGMVAPYVGAFQGGGEVPRTGLAMVHKGEQVVAKKDTKGLGLERIKSIRERLGGQINKVIPKLDERIDIAQQLAGLSTSPAGSELSKGELNKQVGLQKNLLAALRKTLDIAKRGMRIVQRTIERIESDVKNLEKKIRREQRKEKPDKDRIAKWGDELRKRKNAMERLPQVRSGFRDAITEMSGLTGRGGRIFDASLALKELRASGRPQAIGIADLLAFAEAMRYGAFKRPAGMAAAAAGLPTFHQGGTVPGPRGRPTPVMALGGERFLGAGQGAPVVEITFADGMGWLKDFVDVRIKEGNRRSRRTYGAGNIR